MALYKCQSMGLLPTSPSDWIEFVEHKEVEVLKKIIKNEHLETCRLSCYCVFDFHSKTCLNWS